MTCRIDRLSIEQGVVLRICGRITGEGLDVLRTALAAEGRVVALDLTEVELVDRDAVALLALAEGNGIELGQCPAYIREWVTRERRRS
jgi:anti-anti-sigma regulatory factor